MLMFTVYFLKISVKSKMLLLNFGQDNTVNAIVMDSKMFYFVILFPLEEFELSLASIIVSPEDGCCLL